MVTSPAKPRTVAPSSDEVGLFPALNRLKLPSDWEPTDRALIELARLNEPWDFELTTDRELVFVSPKGPDSSARGVLICAQVHRWSESVSRGQVFGPRLGVRHDDGSMQMPDIAWISDERWGDRSLDDEGLLDACPELIVEIVSATDILKDQETKMEAWLRHGALLGWLIDPFRDIVTIYRPDAEPKQVQRPDTLNGEDVCQGLEVGLRRIWK